MLVTLIVAAAMAGPYHDLTQVCAPCTTTARLTAVAAPLREVRVIVDGDLDAAPALSNQNRHWLAIRTAAGWYLADLGTSGMICGGRAQSLILRSATGLVAHDVLGTAAAEVELDVDVDIIGGGPQVRDRHHWVCSLGAGAVPRCADLFVRRYAAHSADSWDYTLTLSRKGVAHLHDDSYGHADDDVALAFP
jgi:hypothetical protein